MKELWDSTSNLFKRFEIDPSVSIQNRKLFEEFYEFIEAINLLHIADSVLARGDTWEEEKNVCKELADVLVVGMRQLQKFGISYEMFEEALMMVALKNDMKTLKSHEVQDGMIKRKS